LGYILEDTIPDETTSVGFSAWLLEHEGMCEPLFALFECQLEAERVVVKHGTMTNASILPASSTESLSPLQG